MTHPQTTAPVLVTGASGYIASWVIQKLLTQGYTVHATVRDLNKSKSFAHLEKLPTALRELSSYFRPIY